MIHLGFELGSGHRVTIPLAHLAITGQTQASGKTTALEALAIRSGLRAVAFMTKRGERGFHWADWRRFALLDEDANTKEFKAQASVAVRLILQGAPGLGVFNISGYSPAKQNLILAAVFDWVYRQERNSLTIVPEAWQFLPRRSKSTALLAAENLVRKGAAEENYLWLDSQDLSSVSYDILRQVRVWIFGVQRQINEIKRTLDYIPHLGVRPKPTEIATLRLGQFIACWEDQMRKVYIQPSWMTAAHAQAIAMGEESIESAREILRAASESIN